MTHVGASVGLGLGMVASASAKVEEGNVDAVIGREQGREGTSRAI